MFPDCARRVTVRSRHEERDVKACWSKEVLTKATTKREQRGTVMWSHIGLIPEDCVAMPAW